MPLEDAFEVILSNSVSRSVVVADPNALKIRESGKQCSFRFSPRIFNGDGVGLQNYESEMNIDG